MKINPLKPFLEKRLKKLIELEPPSATRAKHVLSNSGLLLTSFPKSDSLLERFLANSFRTLALKYHNAVVACTSEKYWKRK